ncbi:type IV pilus secretin PilQ [Ectothiorhodospiraceae bacterium BW-2]|nr:type IV pilus secretin PilQ [Ectothiorhodospiraceae bacterium BW-2]
MRQEQAWKTLAHAVGGALLLLLLSRQAAAELRVEQLQVRTVQGNEIELAVGLSGEAPIPNHFTLENPPRISIDIPQATLALGEKFRNINAGPVSSVRLLEAGGRVRLVVRLNQSAPYDITANANQLLIRFNRRLVAAATETATDATTTMPMVAVERAVSVENIDFRRGGEGEARIAVTLTDPNIITDIRREGSKIVAEFLAATLPPTLQKRLDVNDFATPISFIDAKMTDNGAQLILTPNSELFDYLAYQAGSEYQIEVKPLSLSELEQQQRDSFGYSGEKLSLNFQNIEVRAVLQLIADFTGLNVVASDTVNGSITLRLKNVPWDQALDIILRTRGLGKRQTGNVILVAPNSELAEREKQELEAQQQLVELAPLQTRFFQINYAKASDISVLLKSGENASILSARGQVTMDERTNTLMILDTGEKLDEINEIIKKLDIPIRQVMIESRVVIASDDFGRQLGVQTGTVDRQQIAATLQPGDIVTNMNVNLPATDKGTFGFTILDSSFLLDMELSAMQSEGRGEILSNPRVITSNQKQATIKQGTQIPYKAVSDGGGTKTEFKDAVLELRVTPQITPDNRVVMDLLVSKNSPGQIFTDGVSIDTREIHTQVLVDDGDTVVLGGVFEKTVLNSTEKIPLLGDIPLLGFFFRNTNVTNQKSELLIFVTPKILKDQLKSDF